MHIFSVSCCQFCVMFILGIARVYYLDYHSCIYTAQRGLLACECMSSIWYSLAACPQLHIYTIIAYQYIHLDILILFVSHSITYLHYCLHLYLFMIVCWCGYIKWMSIISMHVWCYSTPLWHAAAIVVAVNTMHIVDEHVLPCKPCTCPTMLLPSPCPWCAGHWHQYAHAVGTGTSQSVPATVISSHCTALLTCICHSPPISCGSSAPAQRLFAIADQSVLPGTVECVAYALTTVCACPPYACPPAHSTQWRVCAIGYQCDASMPNMPDCTVASNILSHHCHPFHLCECLLPVHIPITIFWITISTASSTPPTILSISSLSTLSTLSTLPIVSIVSVLSVLSVLSMLFILFALVCLIWFSYLLACVWLGFVSLYYQVPHIRILTDLLYTHIIPIYHIILLLISLFHIHRLPILYLFYYHMQSIYTISIPWKYYQSIVCLELFYYMHLQDCNDHYQSMNLSTIPNHTRTYLHNRHHYMDVTDIQGARPRFIQKPRLIRQVYNNRNDDIDKSTSNVIIPKTVNKPDRQLLVDDIQGTRTKVNKFTSTRKTNPLNPVYQLPVVQYAPFPQPKFIKDNMQIDDIQGTRMKETFCLKLQRAGKFIQKDITLLIESRHKPYPRKDNFLFDVTDINAPQKRNRGQRCTNPLQPVYKVAGSKQQGQPQQIGFIEGTKCSVNKGRTTDIDFNLRVDDIAGAVARPNKKYSCSKNQEIPQAKVGSYKRGISSNRKTNPLQPEYNYLGGNQFANSRPKTAAQRLDAFINK